MKHSHYLGAGRCGLQHIKSYDWKIFAHGFPPGVLDTAGMILSIFDYKNNIQKHLQYIPVCII